MDVVFDLMHPKVFHYLLVIIFDAEMRSSVNIDNKKNILILGKNATDGLDDTTLTVENEHTINFT